MSETSSICDRRCSNNAIVRKVSNRDLFYHGEWELPDDTIKVTFPAGYDAECMLNNIRIALNAMDRHNAMDEVVINVSSENVGEYHGKESNTTQDGQKDK